MATWASPLSCQEPPRQHRQESQFKKRGKKGILASDPKKKGCKGTVLHLRQDSSPCGMQLHGYGCTSPCPM